MKIKKHFGQHFLKNELLAQKIAASISSKNSSILEIGPGQGALTKFLVKKTPHIKLIEIDNDCVKILEKKFHNITIINGDFLTLDLSKIIVNKHIIIGNFPYNISSQILFKVLEHRDRISEVIGMFQQEVADRICSKPNSKKYGILSVLIQAYFKCEKLFDVSPENFKPIPKVNSSVIKLSRNKIVKLKCDHDKFSQIVKGGFSQRRKKLKNALKNFSNLKNSNLDTFFSKRAEELNVSDFVELTNLIFPNS